MPRLFRALAALVPAVALVAYLSLWASDAEVNEDDAMFAPRARDAGRGGREWGSTIEGLRPLVEPQDFPTTEPMPVERVRELRPELDPAALDRRMRKPQAGNPAGPPNGPTPALR